MSDHLIPLRSLPDQHLAPDEPDVRGWELIDADGAAQGRIEELLVERATFEVAALAVATRGRDGSPVLVVPMDRSRIDERHRRVITDLTAAQLAALPHLATSAPRPMGGTRDEHPGVTVQRTADGGEIVRVPVVEEELVVERRPVVKEVIVIRKRAMRDERVVSADLRRERIEVDRHGDVDPPRETRR
jgi:hypothetical protein